MPNTVRLHRVLATKGAPGIAGSRNSENSKANRIETMKGPRGIWTNLFGGSKKNSEKIAKNKRCYANPRMLLKVMKGGQGGHYPLGHLRRGVIIPWVNLSVTGNGGPRQR